MIEDTAIDQGPSTTVTLSRAQLITAAMALQQQITNDRRYQERLPEQPGPTDTCCQYHLDQYWRQRQMQHDLQVQEDHRRRIIRLLDEALDRVQEQQPQEPQ